LAHSKAAAEEKLKQEGFSYLRLRDYQQSAVQAVELALEANQTALLHKWRSEQISPYPNRQGGFRVWQR
jgi:hypothetical protein